MPRASRACTSRTHLASTTRSGQASPPVVIYGFGQLRLSHSTVHIYGPNAARHNQWFAAMFALELQFAKFWTDVRRSTIVVLVIAKSHPVIFACWYLQIDNCWLWGVSLHIVNFLQNVGVICGDIADFFQSKLDQPKKRCKLVNATHLDN